jgi:hypothetical protein
MTSTLALLLRLNAAAPIPGIPSSSSSRKRGGGGGRKRWKKKSGGSNGRSTLAQRTQRKQSLKVSAVAMKKSLTAGAATATKKKTKGKKKEVAPTAKKRDALLRKIDRLLKHPRNEQIVRMPARGFAVCPSAHGKHYLPYQGLTKRLRELFWPDTEEDPRRRDPAEHKRRSVLAGPTAMRQHKGTQKRECSRWGSDHGTRVHGELESFTNCLRELGTEKGTALFNRKHADPDPCTVYLVDYCARHQWLPLAAEFMLWDEVARVATSADLLVMDCRANRLVLVELKTGYEDEEYGPLPSDPTFCAPLDRLTNCPLNRHQLQLLAMCLMLRRRYNLAIDEACVLRVCPKLGAILHVPMCDWARDKQYQDLFYASLCR